MTKRIFKSIMLTAMIVIILTVGMFLYVLYNQYTKEIGETLRNQAVYIQSGIEMNGLDYLDSLPSTSRITVISTDGEVIYDNEKDSARMDNHLEREEIIEALSLGEGYSKRYSETVGKEAIYYAKKIDADTILRVSVLVSTVDSLLLGMSGNIFWIVIITVIIALFLAKRSVRDIIKPINEMNLDGDNCIAPYRELSPLTLRLERQKDTIEDNIRELKKKQTEFESITSNMSEGLIIMSDKLEVLSANESALRMFNLREIKENDSIYVFDHSTEFIDAINKAMSGRSEEIDLNYDSMIYKIMINPVNEDNRVAGAIILVLDYTLKGQEETLRREFTANVSHELKTPLTSISGFAEIMKKGMVDSKDVEDIASCIYDESQRMITLIDDIIHLSRLDSKDIRAEAEDTDLYDLSDEVIGELRDVAKTRNITLSLNGEHIVYHGVRTILKEMIYNLVDNSIKYGRENGHTDIGIYRDDHRVVVSVTDDGIGIAKNDIDRVFERFYRADKSHSKKISGTGLGLSIVKHGAEYHGGYVKLISDVDKGSRFEIYL